MLRICPSSRNFYVIENLFDNIFTGLFLRLCLIGDNHPVAQHIGCNGFDVLGRHIAATGQQGIGPGCIGQIDGRPGDAP